MSAAPGKDADVSGNEEVVVLDGEIEDAEVVVLDGETEDAEVVALNGEDADEILFMDEDDDEGVILDEDVSAGEAELISLREQVAALEAEKAELQDRNLRRAADMENLRRRTQRELADMRKYGGESVLKEMVGVLDDLSRAIQHAGDSDTGALREGVEMVHRKFEQSLERCHCVGFVSLETEFDPNIHNAIQQIQDESVPDKTVVNEFQKGYHFHERLLRPAMVVVAAGGPARVNSDELAESTDTEQNSGN